MCMSSFMLLYSGSHIVFTKIAMLFLFCFFLILKMLLMVIFMVQRKCCKIFIWDYIVSIFDVSTRYLPSSCDKEMSSSVC